MMDEVRFAEMISKIAHELRSPLTSVKGFSATLLSRWERFSDTQRYELIESIHHDAERMGRIVSEVLDLARAEAGRLELRRSPFDVAELVRSCLAGLSAHEGTERVVVDVPDGLEAIGDRDRMSHVIGNLLENAVKYSDEGAIRVAAERSEGELHIEVRDEGVGIEPERLPHVFAGPAPAGGHATPSGTGLGLYLSRRLVEAHGGTITAESEPGRGATFRVSLPDGEAGGGSE